MQPTELIELIKKVQSQRSEGQTIEIKAANKGCPERLYDTLSSFSNQDSGGIIIFGLDERAKFAAVGVYDLQDLQQHVSEQCQQMTPPVRAVFTSAQYDGVDICAAEIPALDLSERPCYYSGVGRIKGSYVRVGDADIRMTEYEIYCYEAFRRHIQNDVRVVERADISLFDNDMLTSYIISRKKDKQQFSQLSPEQINEMLNITSGGKPTMAALMMFGIFPQGCYPQLAVTAIVVPGYEIGDTDEQGLRFINNKRIEGNIPAMFNEAMLFCARNMKVSVTVDRETGMRRDTPEYPLAAIREAVLNALIHRDYSEYTERMPIQIIFFADRLEIRSPGGLYGRLTVEQLGYCRPDCRNPVLATMAETLTEAENRYSGIPTIRREMKAAGLPAPVFLNKRDEFVVVLYNGSSENEPKTTVHPAYNSDLEQRLLEYCSVPRSREEIAGFLGIKTLYHVSVNYIRPLIESGQLGMTVPDKPKSRNQKYFRK